MAPSTEIYGVGVSGKTTYKGSRHVVQNCGACELNL